MTCDTKQLLENKQEEKENTVLLHVTCCSNDKKALCGSKLKGILPPSDVEKSDCKKCEDINDMFPIEACYQLSTCYLEN